MVAVFFPPSHVVAHCAGEEVGEVCRITGKLDWLGDKTSCTIAFHEEAGTSRVSLRFCSAVETPFNLTQWAGAAGLHSLVMICTFKFNQLQFLIF